MYDIIVVGAGPAGLTAAIYARRANKSVLLLEKGAFGGQITFSPKVENYPGFESVSGSELADKLVEQTLALGAEVEIETVTALRDENGVKTIETEDGNTYEAKAVILALGAKHRHLGLANEEAFIGDGISFCAVCDGAFYAGKTVGLVGGGNSALQEAILLSETSEHVYVIQNLPYLTGEQRLQEVLAERRNVTVLTETLVTAIPAGDTFTGVEITSTADNTTRILPLDGLFVAIGLEPENEAFAELAALDAAGYFDSAEDCLTKSAGVFVAGDCRRKGVRQVTTATGDGATAAIAACRYLDTL